MFNQVTAAMGRRPISLGMATLLLPALIVVVMMAGRLVARSPDASKSSGPVEVSISTNRSTSSDYVVVADISVMGVTNDTQSSGDYVITPTTELIVIESSRVAGWRGLD